MLINLELLRTFLSAADAKTFREAALQRHVTQSAVSQQIKTLEGQLGLPLFERDGRHARLTSDASALAESLRLGFQTIDRAVSTVAARHADIAGEIRIGAPGPFTRLWLRPRVAQLLNAHRALRVRVSFGTPASLERQLVARDLDFVVLVRPVELSGLTAVPIFRETFRAYASPSYWKTHGTPSTLGDFAQHRFIVYDDDLPMHGVWWRATFGMRARLRGDFVCRVPNLYEMRALAEQGVGVAVLPDYFVNEAGSRRSLIALPRFSGTRTSAAQNDISLVWRKGAIESAVFRLVRESLLAKTARAKTAPAK